MNEQSLRAEAFEAMKRGIFNTQVDGWTFRTVALDEPMTFDVPMGTRQITGQTQFAVENGDAVLVGPPPSPRDTHLRWVFHSRGFRMVLPARMIS